MLPHVVIFKITPIRCFLEFWWVRNSGGIFSKDLPLGLLMKFHDDKSWNEEGLKQFKDGCSPSPGQLVVGSLYMALFGLPRGMVALG